MKKKEISIHEHLKLSKYLRTIKSYDFNNIYSAYPKKDPIYLNIRKITNETNLLKCDMETKLFKEHPRLIKFIEDSLGVNFCLNFYYGKDEKFEKIVKFVDDNLF